MKLLTFVIPAYNSAQFLDTCIKSMLVPEVLDRLEILVINDGSADATPDIAEKYCREYPETVRLISQENRGHGGALNTGCAAAVGKYLKVVDADDWVTSGSLPAFLTHLEQCQSDVVLTHVTTTDISNGRQVLWKTTPATFGKAYRLQEVIENWSCFAPCMNLHGITYRRDFYHSHGGQLSEHVFYEDHEFSTFPCCYAAGITALDIPVYVYRIGDENQSISRSNQLRRMRQMEQVLQRMMELAQRLPETDPAAGAYAGEKIRVVLMRCLTTALMVHPDRKAGRELALRQVEMCRASAPAVWKQTGRKYRVLLLMNRLGVSDRKWEAFLHSPLGRCLRGKTGKGK